MEINPFIQLIQPVSPGTASAEISNWQVGQMLKAVAVTRPVQGQVLLQIGSQTLTAQVQFNTNPGQQLRLEVVKLGDLPLLRLAAPSPQTSAGKAIETAIRDALPRQQSYSPLLANLSLLAEGKSNSVLPSNISNAIQLLFKSIPVTQNVSTPKGIQQAIQNSGLFLEAKLGKQITTGSTAAISSDFKAGLLKLQQALGLSVNTGQNTGQNTGNKIATANNTSVNTNSRNPLPQAPVRNTPGIEQRQSSQGKPVPASPVLRGESSQVAPSSTTPGTPQNTTPNTTPGTTKGIAPDQAVLKNVSTTSNVNQPSGNIRNASVPTSASGYTVSDQVKPSVHQGTGKPDISQLAHLAKQGHAHITPANRPGSPLPPLPPLIGRLAHNPLGIQDTDKRAVDPLLAASLKQILEPPMKNTNPQAQVRVPLSLLSQDTLTKLIAILLKDTDSSLARLQLSQLVSLNPEVEQKQVWLFDLPVRKEGGIDIFHMRIEKDGQQKAGEGGAEEEFWSIKIAFNLEGLGPVHVKITVMGKDNVSTTLWAENEQTAMLFNQYIDDLQGNLEQAGLCINRLSCLHGKPPVDEPSKHDTILDEKV